MEKINSFTKEAYRTALIAEEKSPATIDKYLRDARVFCTFIGDEPITKEWVMRYKENLLTRYTVASANSMLASVNHFLAYLHLPDCRVKCFRSQRRAFCEPEKELSREEYLRLLDAARRKGDERLCLILQTICSTGIRVSELRFITAATIQTGRARVMLKGKTREVLLPGKLKKLLLTYMKKRRITSGPVFITRGGNPVNRSNIWREMKLLCATASIDPKKVYPHNLRHLFARCYYNREKDIAKLADVLGHSSIETTRIYLISSGVQHERTLNSLKLIA